MGDYTLAAHMFILINLTNSNIILKNNDNNIRTNKPLGSGAKCFWTPSKLIIKEITKTLVCSSENHKNDLIKLLNSII